MRSRSIFLIVFAFLLIISAKAIFAKGSTDSTITADEIIQKISKNETIKYSNVTIKGDLEFPNRVIPKMTIENSVLNGKLNFDHATLINPVSFRRTRFLGKSSFIETNFKNESNFQYSNFEESAFFNNASFMKGVNFNSARFNNSANFLKSIFLGPAKFQQTKFAQTASFSNALFEDESYFSESIFRDLAIFMSTQFNKISDFRGTRFEGNTDFRFAKFRENADFTGVQFDRQVNFVGTRFDLLNINWQILKNKFVPNGPAYLAFIKNFRNLEQFEDADDCYYQYRNWRRDTRPLGLAKVFDYIAWISCGYGVRWYQPMISGILLLLFFSYYYSFDYFIRLFKNMLMGRPKNNSLAEFREKFLKSLAFSVVTLLSLPPDYYPFKKEEYSNFLKDHFYSAIAERLLGWALFLLLVGTLTRLLVRY